MDHVANDVPDGLYNIARLNYGNRDQLIIATGSDLYFWDDGGGGVGYLYKVAGPYHDYRGLNGLYVKVNMIHVAPKSYGQGSKHHVLYVDENGTVTLQERFGYEFSHTDHDRSDWGSAQLCPRTGREFLGYGSLNARSEWPQDEIGHPMKGSVMEYNGPTPGQWDTWTNQLYIGASNPHDAIGIFATSFVVLDDGRVLVTGKGNDNFTYFILLESRAWDQGLDYKPDGRRAPGKQGYWSFAQQPGGGNLAMYGERKAWDPFVDGGNFNDVIFLFGADGQPWFSYRNDPTNFMPVTLHKRDGSGNYYQVGSLEGAEFGYAVHPVTKSPIVASGNGSSIGFYEAIKEGGTVHLYEIGSVGFNGSGILRGVTYKNGAFFGSNGNLFRVNAQ
ncbi:MAG: hypothetical protein PVG03_00135 [Desulfarculaceae bacterium]